MFNIDKMPHEIKVIILIVSLLISGIILFYLWIISFDLNIDFNKIVKNDKNLNAAAEEIKNFPSIWKVFKSNGDQILNLFKDSIKNIASSSEESLTPSPLKSSMPSNSFGKLPLSE